MELELAAMHRAGDWRYWGLSQRLYMVVANGGRLGLELSAIQG